MGVVKKINFPYVLKPYNSNLLPEQRLVIFFGTNFLGDALPRDWNEKLFIERTNQMLDYIRRHFPGRRLLYQPHPNETTEHQLFNLHGFVVGEKVIAELFLYENAERIEYTFSACSGASISAYAMGLNTAIFLDTLLGALPANSIIGYRSYFAGLPDSFFIKSFNVPVPILPAPSKTQERNNLKTICDSLLLAKKIWVLAIDPSLAFRGALFLKMLRQRSPGLQTGLIVINHRRWSLVKNNKIIEEAFDEVVKLPFRRVWYSARLNKLWQAIRSAWALQKLPLADGDTVVSFSYMEFEENCILSYYPKVRKILFIENRWYHFVYGFGYKKLPASEFSTSWGVSFFNYFLEPLLGLYQTIFRESKDKISNIFRYKKSLDLIYNDVFVLMPWKH